MPLSNVTTSQLYEAISRIGPAQAAEEGYFHALPYGSGGGSTPSNVRMLKKTSIQEGTTNNTILIFDNLGFTAPLTVPPFTQIVVLTPVEGYAYDTGVDSISLVDGTISVYVLWTWVGGGTNPFTGGNVDIGLRVEPFVLSA